MLYFYYGSDFFRAKEAIDKKIASFLAKNPDGLVEKFNFDGDSQDRLEDLRHILKRRSLFDQPELIMAYAFYPASELEKKDKKLLSFLKKEAEEIKEFEKKVSSEKRLDRFALIDAIGTKDIRKAIISLNQALEEGEDPQAILGLIIYQFRNLLKVKSLPAADLAKAGLHPFVTRKTSQQARQFELDELKKIYRHLSELDLKSKTGQIDLSAGLFQFILTI